MKGFRIFWWQRNDIFGVNFEGMYIIARRECMSYQPALESDSGTVWVSAGLCVGRK